MAKAHSTLADRFWSKTLKTSDCWLWTGAKQRSGYGWFNADWKRGPELAHRVAFRLTHGRNAGPELCHTCDVRLCVRPDHLYEGTRTTNVRDCVSRGRHKWAARTHCSHGHQYTPENTYLYTKRGTVERQCRACKVGYRAKWLEKRRHSSPSDDTQHAGAPDGAERR